MTLLFRSVLFRSIHGQCVYLLYRLTEFNQFNRNRPNQPTSPCSLFSTVWIFVSYAKKEPKQNFFLRWFVIFRHVKLRHSIPNWRVNLCTCERACVRVRAGLICALFSLHDTLSWIGLLLFNLHKNSLNIYQLFRLCLPLVYHYFHSLFCPCDLFPWFLHAIWSFLHSFI